MRNRRVFTLLAAIAGLAFAAAAGAKGVVDTRHNLSISGPGEIRSSTESEVCIFCHATHSAGVKASPLWNREDSTANFDTYRSSTQQATVGQPTGASRMCLSCHDGSIALGKVLSRRVEIPMRDGQRFIPPGLSRLGSDISDDHPVSFHYDSAVASTSGELASPGSLPHEIRLDKDGMLQCTSCHDPHDDANGKFLVMDNTDSRLCRTCHTPVNWDNSSHAKSTATWNGAGANPWPRSEAQTVTGNACKNCHQPHAAGGRARLLNNAGDEANCMPCHNGNVGRKNIEAQTHKFYGHGSHRYDGSHDPAEDFTSSVRTHVACVDCHNPHRANGDTTTETAIAPNVPGALAGVSGVNATGAPVQESAYLYEICFKCHADNNVITFATITRQTQQFNTRLEFDRSNPSYHPVEGPGRNPDVPSLNGMAWDSNSVIYCTDCHDSDDSPAAGRQGARGVHGSNNQFILQRNYSTADNTQENPVAYALCYTCHNRNSILNDESFEKHNKHIRDADTPCSVCHDPHASETKTHLINFDRSVVQPNRDGVIQFTDLGRFKSSCSLLCHGKDHSNEGYKP